MWRIVRTLSAGLLWMLLNVVGGIMPGYAFIEGHLRWANVLYYLGFLISLAVLIYYYYRLRRKMDI
jgi:hypothetical protein